jgi:hypothetical protein
MSTKQSKQQDIENLSRELLSAADKYNEAVLNNEPAQVLESITRHIKYFEKQLNDLKEREMTGSLI